MCAFFYPHSKRACDCCLQSFITLVHSFVMKLVVLALVLSCAMMMVVVFGAQQPTETSIFYAEAAQLYEKSEEHKKARSMR